MIMKTSIFLYVIFIFLAYSCTSIKPEFTKDPVINNNPNESVPLSAILTIQTSNIYDGIIIQLKSEDHVQTLKYDWMKSTEQDFPLFMVHPDTKYEVTFELVKGAKSVYKHSESLDWQTPSLPGDPMDFPGIEVRHNELSKMAPGYTLLNPRRRIPMNLPGANEMNKSFGMLLAVDPDGRVIWYYKTDSRISDFDILPDNKISYLTQDSKITVIDFMGNIHGSWYASKRPEGTIESSVPVDALVFHHDVNLMPNGNRVVLSAEYRDVPDYYTDERNEAAPRKIQQVMGDVILEFNPEGQVVWEWHAFDDMDPYRIGYETFSSYWIRRGFPGTIDWSHANAVIYDDADDAFIVNFRYQSALMKIDRKTKEIRWIFGEPSGWGENLEDKLISMADSSAWFWHQHSPDITPDGNLILFNNDNYLSHPFDPPGRIEDAASNVLEFEIDEEKFNARKVWSSENSIHDKVLSVAMGDVDYLSNGNILAAYGSLLPPEMDSAMFWWNRAGLTPWTMIREYEHSQPAELLWELRLVTRDPDNNIGWTLFGAERFVR
jgi:arylsulfate sulfotransferase